jgi:hypothetical protein
MDVEVPAEIAAKDMLARAANACACLPVTGPAETMGAGASAAPVKMIWRVLRRDAFAPRTARGKVAEMMDVKAPAATVTKGSTALKMRASVKAVATAKSVAMMDVAFLAEIAPTMKYAAQRAKVVSAYPIAPRANVETMGVAECAELVLLPGIAMRARAYVSPNAVIPFVGTMAAGDPAEIAPSVKPARPVTVWICAQALAKEKFVAMTGVAPPVEPAKSEPLVVPMEARANAFPIASVSAVETMDATAYAEPAKRAWTA